MDIWNSFWGIVWFFFWTFAFIAYLFALFAIIGDLFRDHKLNGWFKAIWIIFLIFLPFLTALVYVIARGRGMAERSNKAAVQEKQATDQYLRDAVGSVSPSDEIAKAKALLDAGTITPAEYDAIKARALK
jgi:type VI protein secretion system component VasK